MRFDQAEVQWPKTTPSFASIFTATYAKDNRIVRTAVQPVPCTFTMLAEMLRRQGYATAAVVANAAVGSDFYFDQGFDEFIETWKLHENRQSADPNRAEAVTNLAVGQLDRLKASGKPYFLWVHYLDSHAPYEPPGPYRGRFQNDEHFDPAVCIPLSDKPKQQMLGIGSERMLDGRDDLAFYVARYDAEVAYTDEQIGRLLAEMRRRGLLRKTLTVFTADHGESLGEHGYCFLPLILSAACGHGHTAREERRPLTEAAEGWNVVLLTVDTLRADRLGAYGYRARQNSPRIDAQLAAGVVFDNAMAQRASTWPSLASLLTGLYPGAHGVYENGYGFPDALPTLPKLLHTAGYQTGAFLSNMCQANHQGWDAFACSGGDDGKSVRRALDWAWRAEGKRPFLLWVHLLGAHPPYYNGGDRANQLDPGYGGPLGPRKRILDSVMTRRMDLSPRDIRHLNALYDAAVQGSDRSIGALVEGLKASGKLDRTIVVLAADHGEELYQHNRYLYHSCSVYQTTLHVPLGIAPDLKKELKALGYVAH